MYPPSRKSGGEFHGQSHHRTDDGSHQYDGYEQLPAKPSAQRRKQLEVTVTHALFAGDELERPEDAPQ